MNCARALLVAFGCLGIAGCDVSAVFVPATMNLENKQIAGGDPARGLALITTGAHGCQTCHALPGVRWPKGIVGPPLSGMARRGFIAGQLPNNPGVMIAFLQNAPALLPQTGMPNVGLTTEEARHIAAYLYTLEPADAY